VQQTVAHGSSSLTRPAPGDERSRAWRWCYTRKRGGTASGAAVKTMTGARSAAGRGYRRQVRAGSATTTLVLAIALAVAAVALAAVAVHLLTRAAGDAARAAEQAR
jgi:hypothetical protein